MSDVYSVWIQRDEGTMPKNAEDSLKYRVEKTQEAKKKNGFYGFYAFKQNSSYFLRISRNNKNYFKGYFDIYNPDKNSTYNFYIEEGAREDTYDYECEGLSIFFPVEIGKPFRVGDTKLVLENDPNPQDNLSDCYIIKPL